MTRATPRRCGPSTSGRCARRAPTRPTFPVPRTYEMSTDATSTPAASSSSASRTTARPTARTAAIRRRPTTAPPSPLAAYSPTIRVTTTSEPSQARPNSIGCESRRPISDWGTAGRCWHDWRPARSNLATTGCWRRRRTVNPRPSSSTATPGMTRWGGRRRRATNSSTSSGTCVTSRRPGGDDGKHGL